MIDISIFYALCSLLIYGATQVIAKVTVKSLDATTMVAMNFLISIPIYVFFLVSALVLWNDYISHPEYVLYGLIGASTARGGYYIYLEALEKGAVTMVGSITAAFPAITALLAVTLLNERISWINGLGIAIIIGSMIGLSFTHGRSARHMVFSRTALALSVAVLLIWGFGGIFIKLALDGLPLIAYLGLYPIILPPIAFAYLKHKKATKRVFLPKWTVPVIGALVVAELWQLGYFAETSAISTGTAAIVFPLISAYPIVTIIGARLFLGEQLARTEWILLAAVVTGILLTSVV
jgi:transporter family protein